MFAQRRGIDSVPRARRPPAALSTPAASGAPRRATPAELREAKELLSELESRPEPPKPSNPSTGADDSEDEDWQEPEPMPDTPVRAVVQRCEDPECANDEPPAVSADGIARLEHEASFLLQRLRRTVAEQLSRDENSSPELLQRAVVFQIRKTVLHGQSDGNVSNAPELAHPEVHHMLGLLALEELVGTLTASYQRAAAARRADLITSEAAHTKLLMLREDCLADTGCLRRGGVGLQAHGAVRQVEARLASLLMLESCEELGKTQPQQPFEPFSGLVDDLRVRCERALRQRDEALVLAPRCLRELRRAKNDLADLRCFAVAEMEGFAELLQSFSAPPPAAAAAPTPPTPAPPTPADPAPLSSPDFADRLAAAAMEDEFREEALAGAGGDEEDDFETEEERAFAMAYRAPLSESPSKPLKPGTPSKPAAPISPQQRRPAPRRPARSAHKQASVSLPTFSF